MANMTASGWEPSGAVVILDTERPWGPKGMRQALVQLNMRASWFGTGAFTMPTGGLPAPSPSLVGFRSSISYIIPICPFVGAAGNGPTVITPAASDTQAFGRKCFQWGAVAPSYAGAPVSTVTDSGPRMIFIGGPVLTTAGAGLSPSAVTGSFTLPLTTDVAVTDMIATGITLTAYALFVGK